MKTIKEVYYSPKYNRFVQIRGLRDDGYIIGGFTIFYNDAFTTTRNSKMSRNFCKDFIEIDNIDELKFAKLDENTNTWRIK